MFDRAICKIIIPILFFILARIGMSRIFIVYLENKIVKLTWTINWYFQSLEDLSEAVIPDSVYLQKTPNLKSSVIIGMLCVISNN